jgi:hypothetical protein
MRRGLMSESAMVALLNDVLGVKRKTLDEFANEDLERAIGLLQVLAQHPEIDVFVCGMPAYAC